MTLEEMGYMMMIVVGWAQVIWRQPCCVVTQRHDPDFA
jgi:hypothetical protein